MDETQPPQCGVAPRKFFVEWKQIQHGCCPTGPAAPAPIENKGSKYFCYQIMDHGTGKKAGEQIEKETLDLHILALDESQKDKHIAADQELGQFSANSFFLARQGSIHSDPQSDGCADIDKIEYIEKIICDDPHDDGNNVENTANDEGFAKFGKVYFSGRRGLMKFVHIFLIYY